MTSIGLHKWKLTRSRPLSKNNIPTKTTNLNKTRIETVKCINWKINVLLGKSNELEVVTKIHNPDILINTEIKIITSRPPPLRGYSIAYRNVYNEIRAGTESL